MKNSNHHQTNAAPSQTTNALRRWARTRTAALFLATLSAPLLSQATPMTPNAPQMGHQGPQHGCGFHDQAGPGLPLRALNLSSEQDDQVFNILHVQEPKLHENGKIIRANMKALHDLAMSKQFDTSKAEALSQSTGQAIASNMLIRAQTRNQIYQLLTADQRKKLETLRKQFEMHQGAGMPPMPPQGE